MSAPRIIGQVVHRLIMSGAWQATRYMAPNAVIRATMQRQRGKVPTKGPIDMVLHIGRPNYAERRFIKLCRKAKEPFPVSKIILKFAPKPKKAKRRG